MASSMKQREKLTVQTVTGQLTTMWQYIR